MDSIKDTVSSFTGSSDNSGNDSQNQGQGSGGGFLNGLGDKLNSAAGGGRESEKKEDYLDKGWCIYRSYLIAGSTTPICYQAMLMFT